MHWLMQLCVSIDVRVVDFVALLSTAHTYPLYSKCKYIHVHICVYTMY